MTEESLGSAIGRDRQLDSSLMGFADWRGINLEVWARPTTEDRKCAQHLIS